MCRVVGRAEARVKHPFRNRYFLQYADILNVQCRSPRPFVTLFRTVPRQRGIQLAWEACYQENEYSLPVYLEISHKTRHYLRFRGMFIRADTTTFEARVIPLKKIYYHISPRGATSWLESIRNTLTVVLRQDCIAYFLK
jgi:hypothetical protein